MKPSNLQMTTTEEHKTPRRREKASEAPALLVAFPEPNVIRFPADGILGRDQLAARGILDAVISRHHASVARVGAAFVIEDLSSRNGTFVNALRLPPRTPTAMKDGDVVRVGKTLLVFREHHATEEPMKPIGALAGPFGLRAVAKALGSLHARGARNVLLEGETGAGKELVANAVRTALRRAERPYEAVNVSAVTPTTFEGQLFGWVRNAFSGATEASLGLLRQHDRGCVFLDEIGDLPEPLQVKLLRVLDNREVLPVGATRAISIDVAIIAATHRPLDALVATGHFRQDLLARFDQRIPIPPLRARREDIYPVLAALASRRGHALDANAHEVEGIEVLLLHDWPTNVRGLNTFLGALEPPYSITLDAVERHLGPGRGTGRIVLTEETVRAALKASAGNQSKAAAVLGVDRGVLLRFLKKM